MHARGLLVGEGLAPLLLVPLRFQAHQDARVEHAVGERLPTAYRDAFAFLLRDEPADRRRAVEEFDDDARVVERRAVVEDQRRDLAERVVRVDRVLDRRDVDQLELELDLLFGEEDAHLARVGAGERGEELHEGRGLYLPHARLNAPPQRRDDIGFEPWVAFQPCLVAPTRVRQRKKLRQVVAPRAHGFS